MKRISFRFSVLVVLLTAAFMSVQATDNNNYLHFVSLKGGDTIRLDKNGDAIRLNAKLEYSTNNRQSWSKYKWSGNTGDTIAFVNVGDTIWFRASDTGNSEFSGSTMYYYHFVFGSDDSIAAGGNIMSLFDGTCQRTSIGTNYNCFYGLFLNCKALITAPLLTATQLAPYCYNSMFAGCTSLTTAPSLQATQLDMYCYQSMFAGCTSLKVDTCDGGCAGAMLIVPDTTPAPFDWNSNMFQGCQGDSIYTSQYGIKLGGRYCIMGTGFTVTVDVNDSTMGSVTGGGIYDCGDTVTITATANEGYDFVGWSTGDTTATLTFIMGNCDTTITATFEVVSAVEETEADRYVAYAESGNIIVDGVAGCSVAIYDINGRLIGKVEKADETERFAVGMAGVYVISVDNKAETRVVVK